MIVKGYVPPVNPSVCAKHHVGDLQLANTQQDKAMQDFVRYLAGFRGLGQPLSRVKAAVVQTQTYQILLQPSEAGSSSSPGLCFSIVLP